MIEWIKIIGFSICAAMAFGILHDMVTAHVAVEYFTIAHPPVFPTDEPFWLAIGWGIIATWWMGAILGFLLACSARIGTSNRYSLGMLRPSIFKLVGTMAITALIAGLIGLALQASGNPVIGIWADTIEPDRQAPFAFALWAHSASYLVGGLGGLIVCGATLRERWRQASSSISQ